MACTRVFFKFENPSLPKGSRWGPLDGVQFIWARGNPGDRGAPEDPKAPGHPGAPGAGAIS